MDSYRLRLILVDELTRRGLNARGFSAPIYSPSVQKDAWAIFDSLCTIIVDGAISAPVSNEDVEVAIVLLRELGIKNV